MDTVSQQNFKAIQDAIVRLTNKCEEQEKRINSHIQSQQTLMNIVQQLQQEVIILKVQNRGTGPTEGI